MKSTKFSTQNQVKVLNNGIEMPIIGLGTYLAQGHDVFEACKTALQLGLRHIDTANMYRNHSEVAEAIKESGVKREDIFITTKLSPNQQGAAKAEAGCKKVLKELETDYIDLVLIHWPGASGISPSDPRNKKMRLETWQVLEKYNEKGIFRSIGVSNFEPKHIQEIIDTQKIKPVNNQVEVHPQFPNIEVRQYCKQNDIAVTAYASLGMGTGLLDFPQVSKVAKQVGKSNAQVLLRWGIQSDLIILPKSVKAHRIKEFTEQELFGFELSQDQMKTIDSLYTGSKLSWDPRSVK